MTKAEAPRVPARGLVTVAFLKARLDEGNDHLGIFLPLVIDVLAQLPNQSFTTADVQEALAKTHGIAMPQEAVATLLKRATRKHYVLREAGRFHRDLSRGLPQTNVVGEKAQIEQSQRRLGEALREHGAKRGLALQSTDVALEMLIRFLEEQQVALLLGDAPETKGGTNEYRRDHAIIAEFLHDVVRGDSALVTVARGMIEGLVLYHAAFLPDLAAANRSFRDLRVVFDSVLVRQALGYEGAGMRVLMRETIGLLKASGAQCLVFDETVEEIQRILAMYEDRLATLEGRGTLRPGPMARHFLTQRYSASDVSEMSALLEREIAEAGFQIQAVPRRIKEHTSGEKSLAKRLADPSKRDDLEPRVMHDVDCVAGVLTLRKDHRSHRIEDARVVFATSAPLVIRNTRLWWEEDERGIGVAPIVHIRALANLAWLKKPSISADFKMHELLALCAAAMRPAQETWRRFLRHLESLRASKRLSSDEVTAIVVSALSDRLLREAEVEGDDPSDIDAITLDEIVERVKTSYGTQSEERMRQITSAFERRLADTEARALAATSRAATVTETMRRKQLAIEGRAQTFALYVTRAFQWLLAAVVVAGAGSLIIGHPFHGGWLGILVGVAVIVFVSLELVGILRHLSVWRASLEVQLGNWLRDWLGGDRGESEPPAE